MDDPVSPTALVICEHCDAVYRRQALAPKQNAYCSRCGTELYRDSTKRYQALLPIVLASAILFAICNAFPIVAMEIQGLRTQTTVWESVLVLLQEEMISVALLVFATTILFPAAELLMLLYLLVPLAMGRVPRAFGEVIRAIRLGRPWGMIEVFMLGIIAALVKLSTMATIIPGVALWSFGLLTILLTIVLSFDPAELWEQAEELRS